MDRKQKDRTLRIDTSNTGLKKAQQINFMSLRDFLSKSPKETKETSQNFTTSLSKGLEKLSIASKSQQINFMSLETFLSESPKRNSSVKKLKFYDYAAILPTSNIHKLSAKIAGTNRKGIKSEGKCCDCGHLIHSNYGPKHSKLHNRKRMECSNYYEAKIKLGIKPYNLTFIPKTQKCLENGCRYCLEDSKMDSAIDEIRKECAEKFGYDEINVWNESDQQMTQDEYYDESNDLWSSEDYNRIYFNHEDMLLCS